jgi:hypothetical protein
MNVEIGTETPIFLFWEYLFQIFGILSLQCNACSFARLHCKENPISVFIFWKLRGLILNFYIHVSVSYLYIPRKGPHISLQQNRQTDPGIYKSLIDI